MSVVYINEQGAYLRKNGGRFVVTKNDETLFSIPEAAVDEIVILGNVQVSTQAVSELLKNGVELLFLSGNGKFKGILEPGFNKNVFLRVAQYDASIDGSASFKIARTIVAQKIKSGIETLDAWSKKGGADIADSLRREMRRLLKSLDAKTDNAGLRAAEGVAAKLYFSAFANIAPPPFEWNGRTRRPPRDPVNALLSLTYMMTLSQIISKTYAHGFDPFIGFLHELEYGRPSFALDILELFRCAYCDKFVFSILRDETLLEEDFNYDGKNGCRLSGEGFKKYLHAFDAFANKADRQRRPLNRKISEVLLKFAETIKRR